jgi:hypothetical protein
MPAKKPSEDSVRAIVRKTIGKKADTMPPKEFARLTRAFIRAGKAELMSLKSTPGSAASQMVAAKKRLALARRSLAKCTRPGHSDVIVSDRWKQVKAARAHHLESLLKIPNVVGVGYGFRRRKGGETNEECLQVLVTRKFKNRTLLKRGIEKMRASVVAPDGREIPVDVIDFGRLNKLVKGGDSLGPQGKHYEGTIGTFAIDDATGDAVALTAMHVTKLKRVPPSSYRKMVSPSEMRSSPLILGTVIKGTMHGIDAAKISVDPSRSPEWLIDVIGDIKGWRPVAWPGDRGTPVRLYGTTSYYSVGRIVSVDVDMPEHNLESAIVADIPTKKGDSGAALVDNENLVLGLLVGSSTREPDLSVFTPISKVLNRLSCDIPST